MIALIVGNVLLGVGLIALAVVLDRVDRRSVEERRHLTHIAISRHVGEIRAVEGVVVQRPAERAFPSIEGLS